MSENARSWLTGIFIVGLLALITSVAAVSITADGRGRQRQPNHHPETYPRSDLIGVTDHMFIASANGPTPQQVCLGGAGVVEHWQITGFDGSPAEFIKCDLAQSFGDSRPASPSFEEALTGTVRQPWLRITAGAIAALMAIVAFFGVIAEQARRRDDRRCERERQQQVKEILGQKTALLGAAYAGGMIDDQQLDDALGRMVSAACSDPEDLTHEQASLLMQLGILPRPGEPNGQR